MLKGAATVGAVIFIADSNFVALLAIGALQRQVLSYYAYVSISELL